MKFSKKTLKFVNTHEGKARKVIDWFVTIGNLVLFIFKLTNNN